MTDDDALAALLRYLHATGYRFVTATPATHARVAARPDRQIARSREDVLGWSLPFAPDTIEPELRKLLHKAGALAEEGALLRSKFRVSTLHDMLFVHSAYPTEDEEAVFFGPDSYRFADLIASELDKRGPPSGGLIVDIGTGAGVGAIVAGKRCPSCAIIMTDINARALELARINASVAGISVRTIQAADLESVENSIDLALANPPYIIDPEARMYRDGGKMHGAQIAFDMVRMTLPKLAADGRMILYTGSAIVAGQDGLRAAIENLLERSAFRMIYRELDPDVFGEELENPQYSDVDRIALIAAIIERAPES